MNVAKLESAHDGNTMLEHERKMSLSRWHRKHEASPDPGDSKDHPDIILLSTAAFVGPMLSVKGTTPLGGLATCLRFDLAAWRDLTPETQKWTKLTEDLLALQRSRRSPQNVLRSIEQIKLLAIVVRDVAREGACEAKRRSPVEETECIVLSNIAVDADAIAHGTKELEDLFNRGGDILRSSYKQQALYWQCN
ncbi:hypothetical protein AURDEDRAFT_168846 [Auricularia subglabra TFB-10046 SS5]|nr:hypothetical protein AURDEDRAFT_168846 [Auricularia subglabra TFB-10046 SS5]